MQLPGILLSSLLLLFSLQATGQQQHLYFTDKGHIDFTSDAPLEVIKASSDELAGILNTLDRSFTFSIPMTSFEGFNSALQRTHFNENYMESEKYPKSGFKGKIIEEVDFSSPGSVRVRAKGILNIHGIAQERIIRCEMKISPTMLSITSKFTVPLADHDIKIPSIVQQKIAEIIDVYVAFQLEPMK